MAALKNHSPRFDSRRTSAIAHSTPKTVFSGTAISTAMSVSLNALRKSGSVSAAQTGASPSWNVRKRIIDSGRTSTSAR